eukprot:3194999-Amphidinium_carterae.1
MVFLFGHEDHPYRQCKISKVTSGVMSREMCEPNRQWYAAQSGDVLQSAFVEAATTDNLQSLVGLQQLPCLKDFINERAEEKIPKQVFQEPGLLDKEDDSEDSDEEIVGIAAEDGQSVVGLGSNSSIAVGSMLTTPPSKAPASSTPKRPPIGQVQRALSFGASNKSVCSTTASEKNSMASASILGGSDAGQEETQGVMGLTCNPKVHGNRSINK